MLLMLIHFIWDRQTLLLVRMWESGAGETVEETAEETVEETAGEDAAAGDEPAEASKDAAEAATLAEDGWLMFWYVRCDARCDHIFFLILPNRTERRRQSYFSCSEKIIMLWAPKSISGSTQLLYFSLKIATVWRKHESAKKNNKVHRTPSNTGQITTLK